MVSLSIGVPPKDDYKNTVTDKESMLTVYWEIAQPFQRCRLVRQDVRRVVTGGFTLGGLY